MRAVVFERSGGPDVLEAKEDEGRGYGSSPPAIIGVEGAGTIAGSGERVAWSAVPGSYAQRPPARCC